VSPSLGKRQTKTRYQDGDKKHRLEEVIAAQSYYLVVDVVSILTVVVGSTSH
jgi:hypothetical protein